MSDHLSKVMAGDSQPDNGIASDTSFQTLEISRRFSASRERVFSALSQPELFQIWWGPKGCRCTICEIDFRVGGKWLTILESTQDCQNHTVGGEYREILPPERLVFSWAWQLPDGNQGHETEVSIQLYDEGDKTLLKLYQKVFENVESCEKHRHGWESSYDCLDQYLAD
ncbi:SRPBCC domain-containing protein [Kiloniella laminariae]|uniref:SRPBCC domain-containing protein n=1 Tax=Kiloniella laminariae TaxID=454162 RepID=A0ABT4LR09_9PROT|nr:SRPBCC domain-containing protein [Kiloniella laminariae]MCZ4282766.1 SRPBCC domain-containing protein [Kiloniella laminariae]